MLRIVLGVIVGFVVWTIIWVGSDQVLIATMGWYAEHQRLFDKAMFNKEPLTPDTTFLIMNIVRSMIVSIISGYVAVLVANENKRSSLILGILVLLVGILVEFLAWNQLPLWYHFVFLFLLIPMTIMGGKLKKFN